MINTFWIRLAGYSVIAIFSFFAYNWFISHHQDIGYQRAVSEYSDKLNKAKDDALSIERDMNARYTEAKNARIESEKLLDLHRRNARAADERLRLAKDDFSQRLSAASAAACRNAAETAATLLGECSGRYREVAESADRIIADREALEDAWPVVH